MTDRHGKGKEGGHASRLTGPLISQSPRISTRMAEIIPR